MKKLFHPLLTLIATAAENELAAIIQYLKEENRILRDKLPERVSPNVSIPSFRNMLQGIVQFFQGSTLGDYQSSMALATKNWN